MRIELSSSEHLVGRPYADEPELYFVDIEAKLYDWAGDDEVLVGRASAAIFRHGYAEAREVSLFEVGDSIDQETHEVWCAVMDCKREQIRPSIAKTWSSDILYLKRAELVQSHRGRGLSLLLVHRIMQRFGSGCAIAVMEPAPINRDSLTHDDWRKRMAWEQFAERDLGVRKLRKHWRKLGFKPVPGSKQRFFFLDLMTTGFPDAVEPSPHGLIDDLDELWTLAPGALDSDQSPG